MAKGTTSQSQHNGRGAPASKDKVQLGQIPARTKSSTPEENITHMIRSYYRCCCTNEPIIFINCVHLKLGHRFHALLKVPFWSWWYCPLNLPKWDKLHCRINQNEEGGVLNRWSGEWTRSWNERKNLQRWRYQVKIETYWYLLLP